MASEQRDKSGLNRPVPMPFDPLSVIGYVGTTAGLLGFLVSTVTRLEQFGRDYRGCRDKLRWYNSQLATCILHLRAWKEVWCDQGRPYPDEDYHYFLGAESFEEMKTKVSLIHTEIDGIGLVLYSEDFDCSQPPTKQQWEHWRTKLVRLQDAQRMFLPDESWLQRVCFASFRGMNLEERIRRLKDKISDLKEYSKLACWTAQFRPEVNNDITDLDLLQILDRKARLNDLTLKLQALYQQYMEWGTWSLVLSPPDDEGGPCSIDHSHDVLIEFDVRRTNYRPRDIGIVPFRWSRLKLCPSTSI